MRSLYLAVMCFQRCKSSNMINRHVLKLGPNARRAANSSRLTSQTLGFNPPPEVPDIKMGNSNESNAEFLAGPQDHDAEEMWFDPELSAVDQSLGNVSEQLFQHSEWKQDLIGAAFVD